LQYRWTRVGRAEVERRQPNSSARRAFAGAFDRDIGQVLGTFFRMDPGLPIGDRRPF
jgi:hypothetical protein